MGARTVAIIGAGFSGTTVAVHLQRASRRMIQRVYVVERADHDVGGVAYQTPSASRTLNVPGGRMSAFEDDSDDFLRFVSRWEPALTGGSFILRRLYGEYPAEVPELRVAAKRVAERLVQEATLGA